MPQSAGARGEAPGGRLEEDEAAEEERRRRIRSWLQAARRRLKPDDHAAFGQALRELQKARGVGVAAADVFGEGVLRSVARLLWRADFRVEGPRAHSEWAEAFEEGLPMEFRRRWRSCLVSVCAEPLPEDVDCPEERQLQRQLKEWLTNAKAQDKCGDLGEETKDSFSSEGKKPMGNKRPSLEGAAAPCGKRVASSAGDAARPVAPPAASPLPTGDCRSRTLQKCKSPMAEADAPALGRAAARGARLGGRASAPASFQALAAAATPARAGMRRSSGAPPAETQPRQGRPGSPRRQRAAQASSGSGRKAGASGGGQRRCSSFADRTAAAAAAAPAADASPEEAALEVCTQRVACSICCEEAPLQSAFRLACRHGWYCGGCMQRHAEARLASGSAEVPCPECYAPVAERDLRKLLPPAIVERLLARSLEQAVSAAPDLRACPTPNCPMRVALDEGETGRLHCPMCRKVSCLRCGARPFHRGLTCDEHARRQRLKGNGQDEESLQKWMDSVGAKKCPSCSMAITKQTLRNQATQYSECHKMKCRNCSTRFCFKCLAVLTDTYTCGCSIDAHGFIDPITGKRLEHLRAKRRRSNGSSAHAKAVVKAKAKARRKA